MTRPPRRTDCDFPSCNCSHLCAADPELRVVREVVEPMPPLPDWLLALAGAGLLALLLWGNTQGSQKTRANPAPLRSTETSCTEVP